MLLKNGLMGSPIYSFQDIPCDCEIVVPAVGILPSGERVLILEGSDSK